MPFNLTDPLFESFSAKIKPCNMFDLNLHVYDFDSNASFLIIHLNICSLQAYFDDFNLFLQKFSHPPSIIFLSETRININPIININSTSSSYSASSLSRDRRINMPIIIIIIIISRATFLCISPPLRKLEVLVLMLLIS